jgi:hypothetical protein
MLSRELSSSGLVSARRFRNRVRMTRAIVGALRMTEYEPSDELQVLMELGIEPAAAKQGLPAPS